MHLTHTDDQGPADAYITSFERVWDTTQPIYQGSGLTDMGSHHRPTAG
jgi:hypothetical protein